MANMNKFESFQVTYEDEKYEIGDFINRHPGGVDVLLQYKDKDITKAFNHIGHSGGAQRMLRKRLIKKEDDAADSAAPTTADNSTNSDDDTSSEKSETIDRKFVVKKLFTKEDYFNTHKTLGFLSLLSYLYRYFYVFPTTGRLGIDGDFFSYFTLLLHMLLSCSSLIFHVLRYRIQDNPLIIYEEYRLHAIVFTLKGVIACIYGLNVNLIKPELRTPILVFLMLGSHMVADLITAKFGKKGVTAVRNTDNSTGFIRLGMRSYAFYQILAQGCFLKLDDSMSDLGFNTFIAIQSSAFLMTLKRKNLINWPTHAAGYSVCLFLSTFFIWYTKGTQFVIYMSLVFLARTQLRVPKYLLWTIYSLSVNYLL